MTKPMWLIVGIGGGLGALAREGMSLVIIHRLFPLNYFVINISGSFLIGMVMAASIEFELLSPEFRLFTGVGVLGGFTTFSTYMLGVHNLLTVSLSEAFWYLAGTFVSGLLAAWSGLLLVRLVMAWSRSHHNENEEGEWDA
jgi:CrcB protein